MEGVSGSLGNPLKISYYKNVESGSTDDGYPACSLG